MILIDALCVGGRIAHQLTADQDLTLIGHTSRGCFLQTTTAPVWTAFLSEETHRGPLTINLPAGAIMLIKQTNTQTIPLIQNILHFSDQVQLSLQDTPRWQTPSPIKPILHFAARQKTIAEATCTIQQRKGKYGINGILQDLLPLLEVPPRPSSATGQFTEKLQALIAALQSSDTSDLLNHLAVFLGQGSGLTPSGDDFLLGLFLTLNRWPDHFPIDESVGPLGWEIVEKARHQTTHLSANLIECAIHGEADQRLINALDGLMTNEKCALEWMDGLINWGNSSGLDAFAGMILANNWQSIRL